MKRSSSTSMISELQNDLASLSTGGSMRKGRANSGGGGGGSSIPNGILGGGLKNKKHLSSSNASLPGDLTLSRPWASPRRQPLSSPLPFMRINSPTSRTHRVEQLRKEESVDERRREEAGEREFREQLQLNHSCHELKLDDENEDMMEMVPAAIPFLSPSSPILPKQMRSRSLTPTSPSSTRTFSYSRMRSCSPILRPSTLCIDQTRKRKRNDQEDMEVSPTQPTHNPAKRAMIFASPLTLSPCVSPLSCSSPLHHSSMESRPAFDPPAIPYESPPDSISYMASLANPSRPEDSMDLSTHTVDVLNSSPGYNSGVRGVALALPPNLEVPISLSHDRNHHLLKLGGMKRKLAPKLTLPTPVNSHHGSSAFLPVSQDQGTRPSRSGGYVTLSNNLTPPSGHKQAVAKPETNCASEFYASSRPVTTIT